MSFESGSVGFRIFLVPETLPRSVIDQFRAEAMPPLNTLGNGDIQGWVGHRHLLDRQITEDNATLGGYLTLSLVKAERKIPPTLMRAECKLEELARMQADGVAFLNRNVRAEIRKSVHDRMLPTMPPSLSAIRIVYMAQAGILLADAMTDKQADALELAFRRTTGIGLIPLTADTATLKLAGGNPNDFNPVSFSPDIEAAIAGGTTGQDFLTWLWFFSETSGRAVTTEAGDFAIGLEGPLVFVREGDGAHEIALRKGSPLLSSEAKTALLSGKKLKRSKLLLVRGEDIWEATIDADTFAFRGVKLPADKALDPVSRFQERMLLLDQFRQALMGFFAEFLKARATDAAWAATRDRVHAWVRDRDARS
ncbi:MAG: hypothetical protein O3A51_08525 [Verrucomicrobia bacterium]|nr:hypothetical protein [Verrucomicrobiota bacterium]